jgi:3-oxoacyl-[acyl-carrier protein] reductase
MTASLPDAVRQAMRAQIPLERFGTPDDVAAIVEFLASEGAGYITGQVIHVNGGMWSS